MVISPTAVLTVRCADKGKLVGRVYKDTDGSLKFVALHAQVASASPEGWYDQTDLSDDAYSASRAGEILVNLSVGRMSNATFSVGCGCPRRVDIVPSDLRRAVGRGQAEIRLAHVRR